MPGLGASFGRGAATSYQQDLANSDCVLTMGSSMAEAHPVGFRWPLRACERVHELHEHGEQRAALCGAEATREYSALSAFFLLSDHPNAYNLPEAPRRPQEGMLRGPLGRWLWGGAVALGLIAPEILSRLPVRTAQARRWLRIGSAALGLFGGYALRWPPCTAAVPPAKILRPLAAPAAARSEESQIPSPSSFLTGRHSLAE